MSEVPPLNTTGYIWTFLLNPKQNNETHSSQKQQVQLRSLLVKWLCMFCSFLIYIEKLESYYSVNYLELYFKLFIHM